MKTIRQFYKQLFPNIGILVTAFIIGLSISVALYLGLLQRHFFSWTYLAFAVLIAIAGIILSGWLIQKVILKYFSTTPKKVRNFALLFALIFSLLLLFNTDVQPLYYIQPDSNLQIQFTIPALPAGSEGVRLIWIKTGQGYIHYSNMNIEGQRDLVSNVIIFPPGQSVSLSWNGKVGSYIEMAFAQTNFDQKITVTFNGQPKTFNLKDPTVPVINIRLKNPIPWINFVPFVISFMIAVTFLVLILLILFPKFKLKEKENDKAIKSKPHWVLFALPMIAAWMFSLLVFWPGVLTNDSFDLWGQAVSGRFNDWQSAFYSISLFLLIRIIKSPAFILVIQIVVSALIVAWGLKLYRDFGVPEIVLWLISISFALSPANHMMLITLWKDIPYAFAFLLFTILLIKIFLTDAKWIEDIKHWLLLGVVGFLIAILRQNGGPVVLISLLIIPFIYRQYFRKFLGSLFLLVSLFILVKGPLYSTLKVDKNGGSQVNVFFMHHIAAHLSAGDQFSQNQLDYLNGLLPVNKWDYSCCYAGTIYYESGFQQKTLLSSTQENISIFFGQMAQDPLVDVKHTLCSGEIAYKFENTQCYMKSTHGFYSWHENRMGWIGPNDFSLQQASFLPDITNSYSSILRYFGFLDDNLVFYLKPSFYVYLILLILFIFYRNVKTPKALIIGIPVIFQTIFLFLINFAPIYRYFYSTYLIGLFLIGLIFLPSQKDE